MSPHSWWRCRCGTTMRYPGAYEQHVARGEHDRAMREKIKQDMDRASEPRDG
jgi:hypothetical protein